MIMLLIPGDEREYLSSHFIDKTKVDDNPKLERITPEFLNSLKISCLLNNKIKFKIICAIMLLKNIDQTERLCNRARMIIIRLTNHRQR
ncbi:hypothetical protein Lal_00038186 [Lupinus albus]|nr:hypothetical protein Lal_00038186 [Lupinus albus]